MLSQAVGYAAESWEAGGQTVKPPLRDMFSEMTHAQPFESDPAVEDDLKRAKMLQEPAPLPWREAELQYLMRALNLEDRILAVPFEGPAREEG